jgi:cysteinyl-tRNA synthetase
MHKSLGNDVSLKDALDRWGRETLLFFFLTGHWRKPLDYSDETSSRRRAQLETFRNVFLSPSEPVGDWAELEAALDDDFNTPEALAVMHGWRDHELLRRALRDLRARVDRRRRGGAGRVGRARGAAAARRGTAETSPKPIACATRSGPQAGKCATSPSPGYRLVRRP